MGLMEEELPGITMNELASARELILKCFKEVHEDYVKTVIDQEQVRTVFFFSLKFVSGNVQGIFEQHTETQDVASFQSNFKFP